MHYIYIYYDVLPHHELRTNRRSDDTAFGAGTFSWQDPVHSWKTGSGEVMTVENLPIYYEFPLIAKLSRFIG